MFNAEIIVAMKPTACGIKERLIEIVENNGGYLKKEDGWQRKKLGTPLGEVEANFLQLIIKTDKATMKEIDDELKALRNEDEVINHLLLSKRN